MQKGPSCSAKTITLSLVPWSCVINATNNILSCSDSYLLYEETPGERFIAGFTCIKALREVLQRESVCCVACQSTHLVIWNLAKHTLWA